MCDHKKYAGRPSTGGREGTKRNRFRRTSRDASYQSLSNARDKPVYVGKRSVYIRVAERDWAKEVAAAGEAGRDCGSLLKDGRDSDTRRRTAISSGGSCESKALAANADRIASDTGSPGKNVRIVGGEEGKDRVRNVNLEALRNLKAARVAATSVGVIEEKRVNDRFAVGSFADTVDSPEVGHMTPLAFYIGARIAWLHTAPIAVGLQGSS